MSVFKVNLTIALRTVALSLLFVFISGCGDAGPQRFPIKGTVKLDGRPVNNATLILTPTGAGLAAAATIRDGAFELPAEVGPSSGDFTVRINPQEAEIEETAESPHPPKANARPRIPKIYQRDGALNAKITGESNQTLAFELTTKPK